MQVSWDSLKAIATSKIVPLIYVDEGARYFITLNEIGSPFFCLLNKVEPASSEQVEFETSFMPLANKPLVLGTQTQPFSDAGGFRFRGASFSGAAAPMATTDIDYRLNATRWINGGRAIVNNIGADDQITFQVVDKDNVLGYGANVVLDEFISGYYIPQDGTLEVRLAYPARIVEGLYLRIKYTSTHASGCTLKCNLYLHWKSV